MFGSGWLTVLLPRNFLKMSLFFIREAERLEWCHLHSSVFLPLDPPSLALREKKNPHD